MVKTGKIVKPRRVNGIAKTSPQEPTVTVYTDLPPDVHGQLRCYLFLKITNFVWTGTKSSSAIHIVAKWWGEQSQGTVFKCDRLPGIAKYAIKCGPKQFSSYLKDMDTLVLDFIDSKSYRIQGEARLNVTTLTKSNFVNNDVPIKANSSDRVLGRINVGLTIEAAPKPPHPDEPTLDRASTVRPSSSALKSPSRPSSRSRPSFSEKENVFPSKNVNRHGVSELISQVLQKSRSLREDLVGAQMANDFSIDRLKEEVKADNSLVSPECIREVERNEKDDTEYDQIPADNTVDLLFGRDHIDSVLKKHGLDISFSSDDSSVSTLYDESLIDHLFYKRGAVLDTSIVSSDSEVDEIISPEKPHKAQKTVLPKRVSSLSVLNETGLHSEQSVPEISLSLNKITALGRVNKCNLTLNMLEFEREPSQGTYFVEYKVPISDDDECRTLASRKVEGNSVNLANTNVFPILFDEVVIQQWQVRTVRFKVFHKARIEDSPAQIAEVSVKLAHVLQAERFCLKFSGQLREQETGDYLGLLTGEFKLLGGDVAQLPPKTSRAPKRVTSLNLLISVSCGKALQSETKEPVNSYIVTRMIDSTDKLSSDVVWKEHHPTYNCRHMIPFTLTSAFLDRLRDNYIILEVWSKKNPRDELLGLCKLPTNQFHLSLSADLGEEETPVVAVDGFMPVVNILSNERCGMVGCLLAVGSHSALTELLARRNLPAIAPPLQNERDEEGVVECLTKTRHILHFTITSLHDMAMFEDGGSWGATDCYVTFTLPVSAGSDAPEPRNLTSSICNAASHMKFNHRVTSSLVLPDTTSVQQFLARELPDNSLLFEVWRRCYYPNIRDQVCARGCLALQQLSHVISLNPGVEQSFNVPLRSTQHTSKEGIGFPVGSLSVSLEYNKESLSPTTSAPNLVQLCVGVQRACGLQYAAQYALQQGAPLEHAATVGVDSYVAVEVSFAGIDRETGVQIRSFTPNYGSHFSITLPTLMSSSHSGPPTLAENISKGTLQVSIFHKVSRSSGKAGDILLCRSRVPLETLLQTHTGLHGWVPLSAPATTTEVLAALELEVGFGEVTEREEVISDACGRGWLPPPLPSLNSSYLALDIQVDRIWITDQILLRYRSVSDVVYEKRQCYIRIKFYNSDAVCSDLITFSEVSRDKKSYCDVTFSTTLHFPASTNLLWCLREEALEIQVWLVPRGGKEEPDTLGDTILGCGYVSLSGLLAANHSPVSSAQVVPLVKATCPNLGGGGLHVHTTLTKLSELPVLHSSPVKPLPQPLHEPEEEEEEEVEIEGLLFRVAISHCTNLPVAQYTHQGLPHTYCTLHCGGITLMETSSVNMTHASFNSYKDIKIPYSVLSGRDSGVRCIVHACSSPSPTPADEAAIGSAPDTEAEKAVIGSAFIDLAPLLIGFPSIEGWYLIQDLYSKDTFGQIKVSFTPLELISRYIVQAGLREAEGTPVSEPVNTNFLRRKQAGRPEVDGPVPSEKVVGIENVYQSLADINALISSIGGVAQVHTDPQTLNSSSEISHDSVSKSPVMDTPEDPGMLRDIPLLSSEGDVSSGDAPLYHETEDGLQAYSDEGELQMCGTGDAILEDTGISENPLLDTFDITVETDCLSDTISDITQLLKDVQEQTRSLDVQLGCSSVTSSGQREREEEVEDQREVVDISSNEGVTERVERVTEVDCVRKDIVQQQPPLETATLFEIPPQPEPVPSECPESSCECSKPPTPRETELPPRNYISPPEVSSVTKPNEHGILVFPTDRRPSVSRDSGSRPASSASQDSRKRGGKEDGISGSLAPTEDPRSSVGEIARFPRTETNYRQSSPKVPDFFQSAKELSTTITQLRQRNISSKSNESQDSLELRSSTPVLSRRTPLSSLMRQGPNNDQRARIARIFRQ